VAKRTIFLALRIESFSSHGLSQTFHHFKAILFVDSMATRQKFTLNNIFAIKEEYSPYIAFTFDRNCRALLRLGEGLETYCGD